MNENRVEGAAKVVGGRFQRAAGEVLEDRDMQVRGGVREGIGHVQETAGAAQDILEEAAGHVKAAASTASKLYDGASGFAREVANTHRWPGTEDHLCEAEGVTSPCPTSLPLQAPTSRSPKRSSTDATRN
jgi:uncharacterized protein YjbJ (UPF0337 family)